MYFVAKSVIEPLVPHKSNTQISKETFCQVGEIYQLAEGPLHDDNIMSARKRIAEILRIT